MAIEITIPRLGWNMDEGVFAGWLKQDGEPVRAGDPLFSLEGEKATQDIESFDEGILKISPASPGVGETIAVGAVIGYLLQPDEPDPLDPRTPPPEGHDPLPTATAPAAAEARAPTHRVPSKDDRDRPRISPLARRIARELGVDWSGLRGSGRTGRIRKADILEAARARSERPEPPRIPRHEAAPPPAPSSGRSVPVGSIRRTIASRMVESRNATAPVTLTTTVDATNLVNFRQQFKAAGREAPSYTDFVIKLTALALRDHPLLHARWSGDRLEVPDEAHIGIAVDTEAGLVVPVLRGASALGLGQIAARSRELIALARAQRLTPADMQGGTFTITNLGAFGIETFTPIINPPECAILGLGRIARQPVMAGDGDRVIARERMSLSLTFDHRIVDGAPAARFLQSLGQLIENPGPWLIV